MFCWFFVDYENGVGSHHQNSDLSLLYSWEEAHVDQHPLVADDVLLTEFHKSLQSMVFDVVVLCLCDFYFGVERKNVSSFVGSFVFDNHSPDSLPC